MSVHSFAQVENQPIILTPFDGEVIGSDGQLRGTIFSWTAAADEFASYQIAFYPVYPCQDPLTAFRVNHPVYVEYSMDPFFYINERMELFDGTYVWSVRSNTSGTSGSELSTWSPPQTFELSTGSGLFIEIENPCDTPAGCQQIVKEVKPENTISLGVSIASEETFMYPRALPIRAEGVDYDKVTFKCEGCSDDAGTEVRYYEDAVSSFKWVLLGKGSLGDPFKRKKVDSLNAALEDLERQIADLQQSIADKQFQVDSGIDRQKEVNKQKIKEYEKQIERLDSQKTVYVRTQDSLKTEQKKLHEEIRTVRLKIQVKVDSITLVQTRIDTLLALLGDQHTASEIALLNELGQLNERSKSLKDKLLQSQEEFKEELASQSEKITSEASKVKQFNQSYQAARQGIETYSQTITRLNTELYSKPELIYYRRSRDQWSMQARSFNENFPVKNFDEKYLALYQAAETLSRTSNPSSSQVESFKSDLQQFNDDLDKTARRNDEAEAALQIYLESAQRYEESVDSMIKGGIIIDTDIQEKIATAQDQLESAEQGLSSAESSLDAAIASYEAAQVEYDRIISEYESDIASTKTQLEELEDEIERVQTKFNNKVEKRRAKTKENKVEYTSELSEKELIRIELKIELEKKYKKLSELLLDSTVFVKEIGFIEDDIELIDREIERLRDKIRELENENDELDQLKERLKNELISDQAELDRLIEERNKLIGLLEEATAATKSAEGPYVYYIPPTVDELMKGTADETKFKELSVKVKEREDSLQAAEKRKAGYQNFLSKKMVSIAKNLEKIKSIDSEVEELKKKEGEAKDTEAKQKLEAGKKIKEAREEEQKRREELEKRKADLEEELKELEGDIETAEEDLEDYKELVRKNDSLITDSRRKLEKLREDLNNELQDQRQRENNMSDNTAKLRTHKQDETRLVNEIARANNALSTASAKDDIAGIAASRKTLNSLEGDLEETREQIRFYVSVLGEMAADLRKIKERIEALNKQIAEEDERHFTLNLAQGARRNTLYEKEQNLEQKNALKLDAEKEQKKLEEVKIGEDDPDRANVDSLMQKDEDLQKAQKELKEIGEKIKNLEKEKEKAKADIQFDLNEKKEEEDKINKQLDRAKEELKKAKKELEDFIFFYFEHTTFNTQIQITARDDKIDEWREKDAAKTELVTLKYIARKPSMLGPDASGNGGLDRDSAKCYPVISNDKLDPPVVNGVVVGNEPRTLAMLYQDGKLLYPKWAVIPDDAPLLAKDVVIATTSLEHDKDQISYQCISQGESLEEKAYRMGEDPVPVDEGGTTERPTTGGTDDGGTRERPKEGTETDSGEDGGEEPESEEEEDEDFCVSPSGLLGEQIDLGTYTYEGSRIIGPTRSQTHGLFLWEPQEVDPSKEKDLQLVKVKYDADDIYEDEEAKGKGEFEITAGVMIETTDSIEGSPEGKSKIVSRIVQGDHSGLKGETIHLEVTKTYGDATEFGFDGASTSVDKQTIEGGYLEETFFHYGKGYGKFEIVVQWKRGGKVIQEEKIEAESPLKHQFQILAYQLSKEALDEARKMIVSGNAAIDAAVAKLTGEDLEQWMIFGTQNLDHSPANQIELSFEAESPVSTEPEKEKTADFGIAYCAIKDAPEEEDFTVSSKVPEKYEDIARDYKVDGNASTKKIKQFKIGSSDNLFVIELKDDASPGEAINGTGTLSIEGLSSDLEVLNVLKKLELTIEGVELNEDEMPLATAGTVSYKSEQGKKFRVFSSFDFLIQSFGITANSGAVIKGTVKHDKIPDPVSFEAEIDPAGNFLGKISNLPEIEVKDFKLKKGASVVIDMHSDRSKDVIPYDKAFYGVVIQSAELELPKSFNRPEVDEASTLSVEDFYIAKEGFGGAISMKGQLLAMGYSGYELKLKEVAVKFERNELKEGTFAGDVTLPSPMEGEVGVKITAATNKFAASVSTDKPIQLPQFRTTFVLREAAIDYDGEKEVGTLVLSALINSTKFGDIAITGFKMNSKGEVETESITVEKDIEIGSGFTMNLRELGFKFKDRNDYSLKFDGKVDFKGIVALDAIATVKSGPTLTFDKLGIEFDKGPVSFKGEFTYAESVFEGEFGINIKKFDKGLEGYVIVGSQPISVEESYMYWYTELSARFPIIIGTTGFSILELGGGLGYNYSPPIGNQEGAPLRDGGFAIKAIVGVGNSPSGEVLEGRMEMTYVAGNFSLYGKAWALSQEESIYGEGQINIRNLSTSAQVDGYIGAFIGLPNAEGALFLARGRINFSYPANSGRLVWTEQIEAALIQVVKADASLTISETDVDMRGRLYYDVNKSLTLGFGSLNASFDLEASLQLKYVYKTKTGTANPALAGTWDVNAEAFDRSFDLLSGSVSISDAEIKITPSQISISGTSSMSYKVLWYEDNAEFEIDYTANI
ncbi:hypothetical protein GYB22_06640 [bacterium]|nr:hypothetical protein [bacterium]